MFLQAGYSNKTAMAQSRSASNPLNPRVRHFAEQVIEAYLEAEIDAPEQIAEVENLYADGELMEAVRLIANSNDEE